MAMAPERAVGCVVYCPAEAAAPGVIRHVAGDALTLGEPGTDNDQRWAPFAEGLADGGIEPRVVEDIRAQAWLKLMGNAVFNPLSVLTRATLAELDPLTSAVIELARLAGVDVPRLQTLHAATDLMARKYGAR
jgi:2-dehydropantoate 2-reductase